MKPKTLATICGLAAVLTAPIRGAVVGPPEPVSWRMAHPEAQVLAGVDFRRLAESPDGRKIRDQFEAALGAPLLAQTERLLMSSVVEASGRRSDIVILSGSFSLAQLRKLAMAEGAKMTSFKGLEIAAPGGAAAADPHLAWMTGPRGGTTVLIGTRPAVQAAAERARANVESLAAVNPLFARAHGLAARFPVWVSAETLPGGFGPKALDEFIDGVGDQDLGPLEGLDIGIQAQAPALLQMWIRTPNEATGEAVLSRLSAAAATRETFVLAPWLRELKGELEDTALLLGAPMAAGTVAGRVGPLLAALALPVAAAAPASTAAPAAKAAAAPVPAEAPPRKLYIRISGLDGGPKEIPYGGKP